MKPPLLPPALGRPALPAAPASIVQQAEVVTIGTREVTVRAGRDLLQLSGLRTARAMPGLSPGATLRLEFPAASRSSHGQQAQVTSLAGRALDTPLAVQVRLARGAASDAPPRLAAPTGAARAEAPAAEHATRSDPVQSLAAALGQGGEEPAPRLPTPGPALAARLLQLLRLIDAPAGAPASEAALDELPAERRAALTTALADLRALAREPTPGLWRLLLLPFGIPGEVGDLRLYLRDDPAREGSRDGKAGADEDAMPRRAIFEFDFTRLGRCQLDALCQGRRFDLVLRTQAPLAPELRREIEAVFAAARDAAGLGGELGFRPYELVALPRPDRPRDHSLTV